MKFIKLFFLYSILLLPQFSTAQTDWLIQPIQQKANINIQDNYIELNNGLAKRIFFIGPNLACIDYTNLSNGQQLLRSIEPEARVVMDGQMYNIGGLIGQTEKAYLIKGSEKKLLSDKNAFQFKGYHIDTIAHYIQWKSTTWNSNKKQAKGKSIRFDFIMFIICLFIPFISPSI